MAAKRLFRIGLFVSAFALAACGGGSSTPVGSGTAALSLTDAPSSEFDNVLVTVRGVWFHAGETAGPGDAGWRKFPLSPPRTVDLARLGGGGTFPLPDMELPAGEYRQIRFLLASTDDNTYRSPHNNAVIDNSSVERPLWIPDADHGIAMTGSFRIVDGGTLRLAVDFDIGRDIVKIVRNGVEECLFKPRLRTFDLDDMGHIVGHIDNATRQAGYFFVMKAEQPNADNTYHVVRRFTTAGTGGDDTAFRLSFLRPGTYDVVLRGRGVETVIVRDVPVVRGATTDLGPPISMPPGTEFFVNTEVHPTGAWVHCYQTLPGAGEIPYEIRFRHVSPFTGRFHDELPLSNGPIRVGTYNGGGAIAFSPMTPVEWTAGNAGFGAVADAPLFDRSGFSTFDNTMAGPVFPGRLAVTPPAVARTASGTIFSRNDRMMTLDNVVLFVVHGGMVVDSAMPTATMGSMTWSMGGGGMMNNPTYSMPDLPGVIPGAVYGVDGLGWSASPMTFAVGIPGIADLRAGNDPAANFTMVKLF